MKRSGDLFHAWDDQTAEGAMGLTEGEELLAPADREGDLGDQDLKVASPAAAAGLPAETPQAARRGWGGVPPAPSCPVGRRTGTPALRMPLPAAPGGGTGRGAVAAHRAAGCLDGGTAAARRPAERAGSARR